MRNVGPVDLDIRLLKVLILANSQSDLHLLKKQHIVAKIDIILITPITPYTSMTAQLSQSAKLLLNLIPVLPVLRVMMKALMNVLTLTTTLMDK